MRRRLNMEEEAAALQERYQPAYIEAFLENRQYPDQTIEEWTSAQGSQHYGVHQIYKPLSVSVSISGPTDNHFAVDCSKVDWHPRLVSAVKNSLIEARRATDGDTVTLCDVTGAPFTTEMSGAAMRNAGVIYPIVNGKRLIRSPLIGQEMQVQTPVAYQSNKEARLANWSQGVAQKAVAIIASAANGAVDAANVDQRLFSAETGQKVKQLVEKEISVVGEHFADDSASVEEISAAVSDTIMGAVEQAYQKRSSDVVAFFRHQQAISQRSPSLSSSSQQSQQQQASRSIFSAGAKSEKERAEQQLVQSSISRAIEVRYPTQLSLHKDILSLLASSDQALYSAIGHCLCAPSRNRMRGVGGGGRQRRKQPVISIKTTTAKTPVPVAGSGAGSVAGAGAGAVDGNNVTPQEKRIGAPVDHLASFRTMLGDDQYIRAIASKNALAGVPLSPGFALVECHNDGKKKKETATARRRGLLVESEYMDPTKGRASLLDQLGESKSSVATAAPSSASKRVMPGLEPSNAPISRQMPALDNSTVPVSATASASGRKMPGLETVPTMSVSSSPVAVPVSRQMPSLEAAPIKSAMPGLETFSAVPVAVASAPVASVATTTAVAAQRIKHTPAKQLPQINN